MIAEMIKKKEEEAEAQEGGEAQDTGEKEEVEKKVDPLESIKTEQDKREWVLKELQIIETTDLQRKKQDRLKNYEMVYYEFFELMIQMSNHFMRDRKISSSKKLRAFIEETILPKFNIVTQNNIDPVTGIKYLETEKDRILHA